MTASLQGIKTVLNERIKTSMKLKQQLDSAKTTTKKEYMRKKLTKNNLVVSNLLTALEKYSHQEGKTDDADETRNAEKES